MTLADKREAIEVLLCAGMDPDGMWGTTGEAARAINASRAADLGASRAWQECRAGLSVDRFPEHGETCIEAAYRLIESSPRLRREWFSKP